MARLIYHRDQFGVQAQIFHDENISHAYQFNIIASYELTEEEAQQPINELIKKYNLHTGEKK